MSSELIYSYCDNARRLLRRRYKRESDEMIEDLVADSVCKAIEKLGTLRDPNLLEYWFLSIVHNHAKNTLMRRRMLTQLKDLDIVIDPRNDFDREGLERILISRLTGKQLKVVWMVLIECMSLVEIAKLCGWNYDTTKANWRHGWFKIKDELKEWYE